LHIRVVGTVSGREAAFTVTAPVGESPLSLQATAGKLAGEVAAALTPELWAEIAADEQGRRAAAAARFASGQVAMAEQMYRAAMLDFEAALLGEPDSPDYLWAAAEARLARGDLKGALARLRSLAHSAPENVALRLRLGDVALTAGKPEEAEAAFLAAAALQPTSPPVIEGLARAARARREFDRAEEHYRALMASLPQLQDAPPWLPGLLAHTPDDTIRLAVIAPGEIKRQLGLLYLASGRLAEGVEALFTYHGQDGRPAYEEAEYLAIFPGLDEECEKIARQAQTVFAARALGQLDDEQADREMEELHNRSDQLATLAERMRVCPALDPAHRYRVLAYNLLNQSNFESLLYLRTGDPDRQRRADLLRTASSKARAQACELGQALSGASQTRVREEQSLGGL